MWKQICIFLTILFFALLLFTVVICKADTMLEKEFQYWFEIALLEDESKKSCSSTTSQTRNMLSSFTSEAVSAFRFISLWIKNSTNTNMHPTNQSIRQPR